MGDDLVKILIQIRDVGTAAIRRVRQGLRSLSDRIGLTRVSLRGLNQAWQGVRNVMLGVSAAIGGGVAALGRLAQRGGEVIGVKRAFARTAGDTAAALRQLEEASLGLISRYDLMVGYNRAVTLGSAENVQQFAELTRTALTLGRALGVDAAFALESLNLGIGRQSKQILDNLGLMVSVEEATRKRAETLGIEASALSESEKRIGFRNAALEAAQRAIEQLGGVELNAADNVTRFTAALRNARDMLAELVAKSPVVGRFFEELAQRAKTLSEVIAEILDPDRVIRDIERIEQATMELARGRIRAEEVTLRSLREMRDRFAREGGLPEGLSEFDLREAARQRAYGGIPVGVSRAEYEGQRRAAIELLRILDQIGGAEERREAALLRIHQLRRQETLELERQRDLIGEQARIRGMPAPGRPAALTGRLAFPAPGLEMVPGPEVAIDPTQYMQARLAELAGASEQAAAAMESTIQHMATLGLTIPQIADAFDMTVEEVQRTLQAANLEQQIGDITAGIVQAVIQGGTAIQAAWAGLVNAVARQVQTMVAEQAGALAGGAAGGLIGGIGAILGGLFGGGGRSYEPIPVRVTNRVQIESEEERPDIHIYMVSPYDNRVLEEFVVEARRMENRGRTVRLPRPFPGLR